MSFVINVKYDASVNNAPPSFKSVVDAVVQFFESKFSNPVTVNIDVGYGEVGGTPLGSGALGESLTYLDTYSYSQIRNALAAHATTADDASAVASLPGTSPVNGTFWVAQAEAKALGLFADGSSLDGAVGFAAGNLFDYNTSGGVTAGLYDLFGVVAHEISEVMGRSLLVGATIGSIANGYSVLDLFHYSSAGHRDFVGTQPGYFSIDGGATNLNDFNTDPNGDFGDWAASAGRDSFLAFSSPGVVDGISSADLRELDILGWNPTVPAIQQTTVAKTLTTDSSPTGGGDGLDYDAANETWTIGPGVLVYSQAADGVFSNGFANNTLINHGRIYSAGPGEYGVLFDNGNANVLNWGTIVGSSNAGMGFGRLANGVALDNRGDIFGESYGVYIHSGLDGGTIDNFHAVRSAGYAIYINTAATLTTSITNAAAGTIKGLAGAVYGADGRFDLVNDGTIIGNIVDADGASDVIINHGRIEGAVLLGSGNALFDGAGGTSGPIFAGGGDDRIIAGKGSVRIHVGGGNDTLTAGPGRDQFIFDSALTGQVERITNFNPTVDKIVLSRTEFGGIAAIGHPLAAADFHVGGHAQAASQHIVYNPNTGFLFYHPDGSGAATQTLFAAIGTHLALTHTDFLVVA